MNLQNALFTIYSEAQGLIKKRLLVAEKWVPSLTARAWGIWQNPISEIRGWKVTRLTETQVELEISQGFLKKSWPLAGSASTELIAAGEFALDTLWSRHFSRPTQKLEMKDCHCELLGEKHFVARTELLENDRENALRESGGYLEQTVLFFDTKNILTARIKYTFKIKTRNFENLLLVQKGKETK